MLQLWRRDGDPCGAQYTVTVTETVLHGAETSTLVDFGYITTSTEELIATATGRPNVGLNAVYGTTSTTEPTSLTATTDSSTSTSISTSSTRETTISVTSTLGTTRTLSLISAAPSSALPRGSECPSNDTASGRAPAATIAGSVVGSMAGLALLGVLVSYLLKRKRKLKLKLTVKRKTEAKDDGELARQMDTVTRERNQALDDLERTTAFASPRSFDFGFVPSTAAAAAAIQGSRSPLPPPKHTTVVSAPPPQWI